LRFLNKDIYKVYHDIYILKENGSTSQIDHVITSPYGIFVVETKNYKGWIFGSESAQNWTQVIYRTKNNFHNPIIQNKGHIKHLSYFLDYSDKSAYHSIVTFTSRATLKKVNTVTPVIYSIWLTSHIKKYKTIIIGPDKLKEINDKMVSIDKADWKKKKQHVNDIKSGKSSRNANKVREYQGSNIVEDRELNTNTCSKCGSQLVLRKSKHGEFYGCSAYPKCRFTKEFV